MKNKKIVIAFLVLVLAATYSVQAQSSVAKKLRADLEQSKKHRDEVLMKAQEQQKQRKDERALPLNANLFQQNINNNPASNQKNPVIKPQPGINNTKPVTNEQPILNNTNKKEDKNQ